MSAAAYVHLDMHAHTFLSKPNHLHTLNYKSL